MTKISALFTEKNSYKHFAEYSEGVLYFKSQIPSLENKIVLEAGCGSASRFDLEKAYVVGIDISQKQLDRNEKLKEKICADLLSYNNPNWKERFDLIICWDVLEHLKNPAQVMEQFQSWLKKDGQMIIAFPNPHTLKGVITKHTPLFIHDLFYFFASGRPLFTKGEVGPFKTYFSKDISFDRFTKQLDALGLKIEKLVSGESYQNKFIKKYIPAKIIDTLDQWIMGKHRKALHYSANDLIFLISRK